MAGVSRVTCKWARTNASTRVKSPVHTAGNTASILVTHCHNRLLSKLDLSGYFLVGLLFQCAGPGAYF